MDKPFVSAALSYDMHEREPIKENVPANAMGASSSTPSTGHIDIFDPLLRAKLKKSRKDKITAIWRRALQEK